MNIAVVRGPFLNKWEMQNFEYLADRHHNVVAFATVSNIFPIDEIKLPVKRLFSIDRIPQLISNRLSYYFNEGLNKYFGMNHYIVGLGDQLEGFDIVNTTELFHVFSYQIIKAKEKYNFKVVVTIYDNIPFSWDTRHFIRHKIKQKVISNTDLFIAVTDNIKEVLIFEGIPEDKITVIPYGVDQEVFRPKQKDLNLLKDLNIQENDFVVLFIGRLVWEKGVYDLIFAAKKIISDNQIKTPVKFVFAGSGSEEKKMRTLAKQLSIDKNIIIVRSLPYSKVSDMHNLADVFVLPSILTKYWQEQFGFVLIESMSCGKPIITTMTGSIPYVVGDAAILIPPNDFLSLYQSIKRVILEHGTREEMKRRSLIRAKEKFDAKEVARKFEESYQKVLNS